MNPLKWFFEKKIYNSPKNGTILCERVLGKWYIFVGGIHQTSPLMTKLWTKSLKRIPKNLGIKKILFLGFGAGGTIEALHKKFGNVSITCVEHDPIMIDIAKKIKLFKPEHTPQIILEDAKIALENINEKFDLILSDLFSGINPPNFYNDEIFLQNLQKKLGINGLLLINIFKNKELLSYFNNYFSKISEWRIRYNNFALYKYISKTFIHPRQDKKYLSADVVENFRFELIKNADSPGIRWRMGPIWFEKYFSDTEPNIQKFNHPRVIIWQPILMFEKPKTWKRLWFDKMVKNGFTDITNKESYWNDWDYGARRYRNNFLKDKKYAIEKTSLQVFLSNYPNVKNYKKIKKWVMYKLNNYRKFCGNDVHFFLAIQNDKKIISGGLAIVDFPNLNQSIHLASFINPKVKDNQIGVGLIDYWFKECMKNKISILNFGAFWSCGDPRDWKGFSDFKSKFGIHFLEYPHSLFKIVLANRSIISKRGEDLQ